MRYIGSGITRPIEGQSRGIPQQSLWVRSPLIGVEAWYRLGINLGKWEATLPVHIVTPVVVILKSWEDDR